MNWLSDETTAIRIFCTALTNCHGYNNMEMNHYPHCAKHPLAFQVPTTCLLWVIPSSPNFCAFCAFLKSLTSKSVRPETNDKTKHRVNTAARFVGSHVVFLTLFPSSASHLQCLSLIKTHVIYRIDQV